MSPAELLGQIDEMIPQLNHDGRLALASLLSNRVGQLILDAMQQEKVAPAPASTDRNLSVEEAAERLGVSESYLYNHRRLPFRVKVGSRLLFSANGIERYLKHRTGNT